MIEGRFQEYAPLYSIYKEKYKHKVVRSTESIDLTNAQDVADIYIFQASEDKQCPIQGQSLIEQFKYPQPQQTTYAGWNHDDFVTGGDLKKLLDDIWKVTVVKRDEAREKKRREILHEEL